MQSKIIYRTVRLDCDTGHNILEFFHVLVKVRFDTGKTKLVIWHNKLDIPVASRVSKRIRILGLGLWILGN